MILPAARRSSSRFLVVVFVLLSLPSDSRGDPRNNCRSSSSSSFDIGKRLESRLPTKSTTHMVSTRNQSFSSPLVATTQTATAYRGGMSAQQFGSTNTKSSLGVSFLPDSSGNTSFNTSILSSILQGPLGILGGYLSYIFASTFPYLLTPRAAKLTYIRAHWKYDIGSTEHVFCDSPWTYLTDYGVLLALLIGIHNIAKDTALQTNKSSTPPIETATSSIRIRSLLLLVTYAVQFLGGGIAHGFLSTQTKIFRILWTIVVSNVALSGAVIGSLATALLRRIQLDGPSGSSNGAGATNNFHLLPNDIFWIGYGLFMVICVIRGNLSYQRPAVDTFVAGTSQAMPTFYLMGVVLYRWFVLKQEPEQQQKQEQEVQMDEAQTMEQQQTFEQQNFESPQPPSPITSASTTLMHIPTETCLMVQLGFVLNAVLLPSYALVVQYTSLSTPTINVLLHSWLCMCYTIQGMVLRKLVAHSDGRVISTLPDESWPLEMLRKHVFGESIK